MGDWVKVKGARYYPASLLLEGADASEAIGDVQSRQSFISSSQLKLKRTWGFYVPINGATLLLVVDQATIQPGSDEWRFIGMVAQKLADCCAGLSDQARAALGQLIAVVFSTSPARSYADVKPGSFVYDVDEFRRIDGSFISAAYAASNIVHDANHIWMYNDRQPYTGNEAEKTCWRLQVDNRTCLGLDDTEVDFLLSLIGDPSQVADRMTSDPLATVQHLACSASGKCSVTASV